MPENLTFTIDPKLTDSSVVLAHLPLSTLLLVDDAQFPWFILVPRREETSEVFQLEWQDQQQLLNESSLLAEMLMQLFEGDKMNIAAIGNVCSQLHLHHVVRYKNDQCWPDPIWGKLAPKPYDSDQLEIIKQKVLSALSHIFVD